MVSYSFQEASQILEEYFRCPPEFNFEETSQVEVQYDFPMIQPSERRRTTPPSSELQTFFSTATSKFLYQDFRNPAKSQELCWPTERLTRKNKKVVIDLGRVPSEPGINNSSAAACEWFRVDIIDMIVEARQPSCTLLLGMPGSGKSTLVKYLLQNEIQYARDQKVVSTRFEATKYFRFCAERTTSTALDADNPNSMRKIVTLFSDYYYSIVLRDIIIYYGYKIDRDGQLVRDTSSKYFGNQRSIENLVHRASQTARVVTEESVSHAFYTLVDAIGPSFKHKKIFDIDFYIREALVKTLAVGIKVCIVYDGLDFLSPEDQILDRHKFKLLELVLVMYGFGINMEARSFDPGFENHSLILLRPNTYERLRDGTDKEVLTSLLRYYYVASLSPQVVCFRGIVKGLRTLKQFKVEKDDVVMELAERLYRSLGVLLNIMGLSLKVERTEDGVLAIFNNNLRDSFSFILRLLTFIGEETWNNGLPGREQKRPKISDLIAFISSPESRNLIRKKGYRLVEMLLMFNTSIFENAVIAKRIAATISPDMNSILRPILKKNNACTGLIDNVFNYHSFDHKNYNHAHNLLQKVRILQLCSIEKATSEDQIRRGLVDLGYDIDGGSDYDRSLVLLRYVGFLNRIDAGGNKLYSISTKGRIVLGHLLFQSSYIEHVYHQTLMPVLLLHKKADPTRIESHERWTIASIRNYFVFVSYVKFVEKYGEQGKTVPKKWEIWPRMSETVIASVGRIVTQDYIAKRDKNQETWIINIVCEEIRQLVIRWRTDRVISDDKYLEKAEVAGRATLVNAISSPVRS